MADSEFERKTVSIPREIYDLAIVLAKKKGFGTSFSAYVSHLLQRDVENADVGPARALRVGPVNYAEIERIYNLKAAEEARVREVAEKKPKRKA